MTPSTPSLIDLIDDYYHTKPNFTQHIKDAHTTNRTNVTPTSSTPQPQAKATTEETTAKDLEESLKGINLSDSLKQKQVSDFWLGGSVQDKFVPQKQHPLSAIFSMPVLPTEEKNNTGGAKDAAASALDSINTQAHKANPGPVIAQDIGKPESKEELKKRKEELNKD
ncbi:hypothetical protein P154DRAFT_565045 [Amniculicola lignicola CBS 123094]|uniref:Uncharacterized protein n=1 Tax=Amniculicola lignicola CBS 123094 TaxID=1392246 RepID=A0A6A5WJL7_9PLEO|nr:hypothetical protein P154DRAFT_565045 [Amniculicola lignicola CBS 123094]